jgi:tRNA(Arg) A34 adenosine deaminase TadA
MILSQDQIQLLKDLMRSSAQKGNLATSGLVLEDGKVIASKDSIVASDHDATAHSERILVAEVGKLKGNNYTPGLIMVTVVEPCIMCMSACSQAGYSEIAYIIPADRYIKELGWKMTDSTKTDKQKLARDFSSPIKLTQIKELEEEFSKVFERLMEL